MLSDGESIETVIDRMDELENRLAEVEEMAARVDGRLDQLDEFEVTLQQFNSRAESRELPVGMEDEFHRVIRELAEGVTRLEDVSAAGVGDQKVREIMLASRPTPDEFQFGD